MSHDLTLQDDPLRPVPASTVAAIELRALSKTFGQLQAVDHLTLSVEQGEIFGLLGPNGSGKTATINLISGLFTPTSGEVQVMGYEMPRHARKIR
jgi:ABC-2 type transport system ATP-binding protein